MTCTLVDDCLYCTMWGRRDRMSGTLLLLLYGSVNLCVTASAPDDMPQPQPLRPLPWALFLPLLVWLRMAKITVELVASLGGKEPPRPMQVVHFLRVRRRRLRAVRYHGLKNFQSWQQAEHRNRQVRSHAQPPLRTHNTGDRLIITVSPWLGPWPYLFCSLTFEIYITVV
jgi:hypothetical protein